MSLTRKDFLTGSLAVGALGVLGGCGSSDNGNGGSGGTAGSGGSGGTGGSGGGAGSGGAGGSGGQGAGGQGGGGGIGAKCASGADGSTTSPHSHAMAVPQGDIDDPQDRTYSSTGGAHTHSVSVTAAQFTELAANGTVTVTTSDVGHVHSWTITCG